MADFQPILNEILEIEGVQVSLLASDDGLVIDKATKDSIDPEALGAVASGGLRATTMIGNELAKGSTKEVIIIFEEGAVFIYPIEGKPATLVVVANPGANFGKIRNAIKKVIYKLIRLIQ
ncbi:MAG: dynein regulation protein LC7 [Dictyoglomus sp. NZ13-RE01]|nr:MAG: dynein regulation protein LC7 [Dictyoglomus sp. NZ13-RE01]